MCPDTCITTDGSPTAASDHSVCTENWKTANTVTENTITVFDQMGIFISACCHGIVQTLVEMCKSSELYAISIYHSCACCINFFLSAKYALATTNKVIDVYGPNGATGYDIGCSYGKTVAASSISLKASTNHHRFLVNSFHGHTHN